MSPEISAALSWALGLAITTALTVLIAILSKMSRSMEDLNIKIAVVVERSEAHKQKIDSHDARFEEQDSKLDDHSVRIARLETRGIRK